VLKSIRYGAGRVRTYGYDDFGHVASDVLKNATVRRSPRSATPTTSTT
jgi:hypothetical protein